MLTQLQVTDEFTELADVVNVSKERLMGLLAKGIQARLRLKLG
jgi:hypothetical protein